MLRFIYLSAYFSNLACRSDNYVSCGSGCRDSDKLASLSGMHPLSLSCWPCRIIKHLDIHVKPSTMYKKVFNFRTSKFRVVIVYFKLVMIIITNYNWMYIIIYAYQFPKKKILKSKPNFANTDNKQVRFQLCCNFTRQGCGLRKKGAQSFPTM